MAQIKKEHRVLVRVQPFVLGFASADLSTPRRAPKYLCDFCCETLAGKTAAPLLFEISIDQVDSRNLTPEGVEKNNEIAKAAGNAPKSSAMNIKWRPLLKHQIAATLLKNQVNHNMSVLNAAYAEPGVFLSLNCIRKLSQCFFFQSLSDARPPSSKRERNA